MTESVHAHIQPESHNVFDSLSDFRIVVIEVGLFFCVEVKIEHSSLLVVFPRRPGESGHPVVGDFLSVLASALAPNVKVGVRLDFSATLFEPVVLVGRVVDNQVHNHAHTERVRLFEHLLELVESAVFGIDILVIGDVVAVVRLRRNVQGREPNRVASEALYVFEF